MDLCAAKNGPEHHTEHFELMRREHMPKLVVRRGQIFRLKLICNRPYAKSKDAISLIFTVADEEKASHGRGTLIAIPLQENSKEVDDDSKLEWAAGIEAVNGDVLEICIKSAVTAAVTQWKLDFDSKVLGEGGNKTFSLPQAFYLLFNPWMPADQVYMPSKYINFEEGVPQV